MPSQARVLHDPAEHRPLIGAPWSDAAARDAITRIAADAVGAYRAPQRRWPNHDDDLEGEPDRPYRCAYFGAAGMAWGLDRLARADLCDPLPAVARLADALSGDFLADPELTELVPTAPPAPSLLFGESGIRLAVEAIEGSEANREALATCIAANARNPTLELCWGSPGTMVAALGLWRATGEARWRDAWRDSAGWLLDRWRDRVWTQDLYGQRRAYTGAGHGFAGNAAGLLAGADLLGDRAGTVMRRAASALRELAVESGELAQWPSLDGCTIPRQPSVQWCHGAPGMVICLAALPAEPETDRLLLAGGELTWRAGALRKGVGLCHGTAGNAYALLALFARTGDERWLARARAFAMDAVADVARRHAERGRGRYALFTGDLGVALLLRGCLAADATFPFLGDAL